MFAGDFDVKGTSGSFAFSITVHVLAFLMFLSFQAKQKRSLADYTLTEITMMETVPDEQKPVEVQKPKSVADMFKQLIPIKQSAPQVELAKPQAMMEKPKLEMSKPQALALDKMAKLDPAMKKIDISNEIGKTKLSPAQIKAVELNQSQQREIATTSQKVSLSSQKPSTSFLPSARPGISTMKSSQPLLKPETVKIDKPTPVVKAAAQEKIEITQKKGALLITGQIANRRVIRAAKPPYPLWAQEKGIQAEVFVNVTVKPDGTVKDNAYIQTSSGYGELDQLAMEAIMQFIFAPSAGSADETGVVVFRFQLER